MSGERCTGDDVQWLLEHAETYVDGIPMADGDTPGTGSITTSWPGTCVIRGGTVMYTAES